MDATNKTIINQIKSKSINILNIKCKYIFEQIFNNIPQRNLLKLIKHNKEIQKLLNIDINHYKEFAQIELEIIPVENECGEFIHIDNKENEKYYHIYFNNNNLQEIKRNYLIKEDKISKIKIIIDYQIKSFKELFYYCECIESINFTKFNRSDINDMSYMFYKCSSLKELNLSNFNTNNVIDMSHMFSNCSSLKELNPSNFNTDKVTQYERYV